MTSGVLRGVAGAVPAGRAGSMLRLGAEAFPMTVFHDFRLPGAVGFPGRIEEIPGILELEICSREVALRFLFRALLHDEVALEIKL